MNYLHKKSKYVALGLVLVMLMTIPNMKVYSSVGEYQTTSLALDANSDHQRVAKATEEAFWPAVLAVAAGVGLAVVAAVGVVDGWNSMHAELALSSIDFENNYDIYDFSSFDN